ncbi:unnamed protein product [Diabrotica balteata]|uniref:Uncharacterized protein n=1 Tax=Diabrotica balteata TaxID=107213 RepID=A0A9N9SZ12_DIABA|nr:unnamed protein product [Diabrotica balteata]
MGDLIPTDIARAVTMVENGRTYREVAGIFGKSPSTIHRCVPTYYFMPIDNTESQFSSSTRTSTFLQDYLITQHAQTQNFDYMKSLFPY